MLASNQYPLIPRFATHSWFLFRIWIRALGFCCLRSVVIDYGRGAMSVSNRNTFLPIPFVCKYIGGCTPLLTVRRQGAWATAVCGKSS